MVNIWDCPQCGVPSPLNIKKCNNCGYERVRGSREVQEGTRSDGASAMKENKAMMKDVRSWGRWLTAFGVINVAALAFLNDFMRAPYGVLFILVGLASFYFREAAMFVIYAFIFAWVGINNLPTGQARWVGLAIVQFIFAFIVFRKFTHYRNVQRSLDLDEASTTSIRTGPTGRAASVFPWAGCLFSSLSFSGLVLLIIVLVIAAIATGSEETPAIFLFLEIMLINFAVLGLALGVASLMSKFDNKVLSIGGVVAGALVVLIAIAFAFLA